MTESISINIGDVELELFAMRAAFSKSHSALFIADPHFGKEATFRRGGIPVPQGSTDGTLGTIAHLLSKTKAQKLIILGDMFHARSSLSKEVIASLDRFFDAHSDVDHTLIRGNHDAHLGSLPKSWPINVQDPGKRLASIVLNHHPGEVCTDATALFCGHLHPAVCFSVGGESTGKLPCFWLSQGCLVFPAIGEFTGMHVIQPGCDDQVWAIADDHIFPVAANLI